MRVARTREQRDRIIADLKKPPAVLPARPEPEDEENQP